MHSALSAGSVIQLKGFPNGAENSWAHNAKRWPCSPWRLKSVRRTGYLCTGRAKGYLSCSQRMTSIDSLTSHLINLTEMQFCLYLIWIQWDTIAKKSGISYYEDTACWLDRTWFYFFFSTLPDFTVCLVADLNFCFCSLEATSKCFSIHASAALEEKACLRGLLFLLLRL